MISIGKGQAFPRAAPVRLLHHPEPVGCRRRPHDDGARLRGAGDHVVRLRLFGGQGRHRRSKDGRRAHDVERPPRGRRALCGGDRCVDRICRSRSTARTATPTRRMASPRPYALRPRRGLPGCRSKTGSVIRQSRSATSTMRSRAWQAAVAAARKHDIVLTARADGLGARAYDLDEAIRRLKAFEALGADVLYAPALPDLAAIQQVCRSVSAPVNHVIGLGAPGLSSHEIAGAGVRRISLGGSLAKAMGGVAAADLPDHRRGRLFRPGAEPAAGPRSTIRHRVLREKVHA